jgi:hypothetical protein
MKDVFYGGVTALMDNKEYYYKSGVGPDYDHWTENGKEALHSYLDVMTPQIAKVEADELDRRAKDLVLKELKES